MSENGHIAVLKKCLAQCEEAIPLIHDRRDKQVMADHALLLKMDIQRMENWEREQTKIREQGQMACKEGE